MSHCIKAQHLTQNIPITIIRGPQGLAFYPTVALSGAVAGRPTDLNLIMVTQKVTKGHQWYLVKTKDIDSVKALEKREPPT